MKAPKWMFFLFVAAAMYDGILGLLFLAAPQRLFELLKVTPPNHLGYVQFPAALLLIFALIFLQIARDAIANRGLIPYGILLKLSYCGVAGWHWLATGIPGMWKPFVIIDLAMGVLFAWAYVALPRPDEAVTAS
jgi:hypothetical protein